MLPSGYGGELIQIQPPDYITVKVESADDTNKWSNTRKDALGLEYSNRTASRRYNCLSTHITLAFALTVHEFQG